MTPLRVIQTRTSNGLRAGCRTKEEGPATGSRLDNVYHYSLLHVHYLHQWAVTCLKRRLPTLVSHGGYVRYIVQWRTLIHCFFVSLASTSSLENTYRSAGRWAQMPRQRTSLTRCPSPVALPLERYALDDNQQLHWESASRFGFSCHALHPRPLLR